MMTPILSYIFRMSCFETLFTIFCFTSNALYLHSLSRFFGIKYRSIAPKQIDYIYNGITFLSVQLTLDLILPKSYDGLHMPRFGFLVFERPIPELNDNNMNADILFEIIYPVFLCLVKITVALLLYDAFMYFIHRLQHSIPFLYRYTHQLHHGKGDTFGSVASRQDIIDRTVSILLANGCLHAVHANPYERVVFIVLFVALLVDSHVEEYHHHHLNNNSNNNNNNNRLNSVKLNSFRSNQSNEIKTQLPHRKMLPFLFNGWKRHVVHHRTGRGGYAPFFPFMDQIFGTNVSSDLK